MYPLTCAGGFNLPARAGKFEVVGFTVVGNNVLDDGSDDQVIEFAIIDDESILPSDTGGRIIDALDDPELKHMLVHKKIQYIDDVDSATGHMVYNPTIEWFPPEPIKTRYGTSIYVKNLKQGSICLYVR